MSQSQYAEMHTRTHKQVAHVVIVLARPFHTSKLKIDASHKQLAINTTTDAVAYATYTCRINWRSGCRRVHLNCYKPVGDWFARC